jgi:hypothetical protein
MALLRSSPAMAIQPPGQGRERQGFAAPELGDDAGRVLRVRVGMEAW